MVSWRTSCLDDNGSTKGGKDGRHLRSSIRTLSMVFGMILAAFVVGAGPQGTPPLGPLVFSDVVTGGAMIVAVALATGAAGGGLPVRGRRAGLFAFGIVLWAAGRHLAPTVDRFFVPTTAGLLWDGLVLSAAIFGVSAVLTKVTGPACRPEPPDEGVPDRLAVGWLAMLVALPIAHLAAVSNDPGQAAGGRLLVVSRRAWRAVWRPSCFSIPPDAGLGAHRGTGTCGGGACPD